MQITKQKVRDGEFRRLHCAECDWAWYMHQPDMPEPSRIKHEFVIPNDIPEE